MLSDNKSKGKRNKPVNDERQNNKAGRQGLPYGQIPAAGAAGGTGRAGIY
jgi:hypothetical protein